MRVHVVSMGGGGGVGRGREGRRISTKHSLFVCSRYKIDVFFVFGIFFNARAVLAA